MEQHSAGLRATGTSLLLRLLLPLLVAHAQQPACPLSQSDLQSMDFSTINTPCGAPFRCT